MVRGADAPARRDLPAPDEATTEPIAIQRGGPAAGSPAKSLAGPPAKPLAGPPAATPTGLPVEPPGPSPLTPAAARRQLRTARRARRRYERSEVRRFTWRTRRRRMAWLVSLGAAAALIAFVAVGAYSPLMALRTIEVVGTNRVPAEQVQAALGGQLGTPLPLVDFGRVRDELSEFTLIRSYVTESRPPGTLVVRVVERDPVGVIPSAAGFDLVDAAGVVIESGPEPPVGYPAIQTAGVDSPGFAAAAAVIAALPESIRGQLAAVTAATKDDVTLALAGGARVVWGSAEESEYKAVVLGALMVANPADGVTEYDVASPDSAVLR